MTLRHCVCCTVLLACPGVAAATDLLPETAEAYNAYIVEVRERFGRQVESRAPIEEASPVTLARLRAGEIVAGPGHEDGIFNVPSGLIHHWRGRAFVPGVTLDEMVAVAQDYPHYTDTYDWVIGSGVMEHEREEWPRRDRYRLFLRIKRSARLVTGVLDLWLFVEYRYPRADLAVAVSNADCIRQVQNEGRPRRAAYGRRQGQRLPLARQHLFHLPRGRRWRVRRARDHRAEPPFPADARMAHRADRAAPRSWQRRRHAAAAS